MRKARFEVRSQTGGDLNAIKAKLGIPANLPSCHTAVVGGYVIEGHVPADDVIRLLTEQPEATGIAVPGMPLGSPSMEYGDRRQAYDVILFDDAGNTEAFNRYPERLE